MFAIDSHNAIDYLRRIGCVGPDESVRVRELAGGVSNIVLYVESGEGAFVLKQSRPRLRTREEWISRPQRIWRELQIQQTLASLLPAGAVPDVLFADRANFLYAMQAVPGDFVPWKSLLLQGVCDPSIATTLGRYLGRIHVNTWNDSRLRDRFGDLRDFEDLRLDPFYRFVARRHPQLSSALQSLIDQTMHSSLCLVLGDFSPKNVLVGPQRITLVDFETGHFGDPAFDLGFFLSHLFLKVVAHALPAETSVRSTADGHASWESYNESDILLPRPSQALLNLISTFATAYRREGRDSGLLDDSQLWLRAMRHWGGCLLARIDGKSPVDYLGSERQKQFVRRLGEFLLLADVPPSLESCLDQLAESLLRECRACRALNTSMPEKSSTPADGPPSKSR